MAQDLAVTSAVVVDGVLVLSWLPEPDQDQLHTLVVEFEGSVTRHNVSGTSTSLPAPIPGAYFITLIDDAGERSAPVSVIGRPSGMIFT